MVTSGLKFLLNPGTQFMGILNKLLLSTKMEK